MRKWLKIGAFTVALIALFFMIRYQFVSEDSSSPWHLPLSGKVIILDPGHGGMDGGAVSKSGSMEKDLTLRISLQLRDYLQEAGALVFMTREEDRDLADEETKRVRSRKVEDLKRRVNLINTMGGDLFISIHLNAIPSPRWRGAQTFYYMPNKENEVIAKFIQDEIRYNLENTQRLAKPIDNIFLLKHAQIPGALVEVGFLSNPDEAALLETSKYQQKIAASIYQGLMRYFTNEKTPLS